MEADKVQEWWTLNNAVIGKTREEVLGKTSGKEVPEDKETWWWSDEVQKIVKRKKTLKKVWDIMGDQEDKERYQEAKKDTKRPVAVAKNMRCGFMSHTPHFHRARMVPNC